MSIGQPEAEADCTVISEDHDEDELGLLDLMDRFADSTESLSEIANGISEETEAIGERLSHHTKEIASVNDQSSNTPIVQSQLRSKAKRTINRAATDLFAYAVSLRTKLPLFDQYLSEGVEAAGQVAVLSVTDLNPGRERIAEAMQSLDVLYKSIGDTIESMTGFRDSALKLPRLTSKLSSSCPVITVREKRARRRRCGACTGRVETKDRAETSVGLTRLGCIFTASWPHILR